MFSVSKARHALNTCPTKIGGGGGGGGGGGRYQASSLFQFSVFNNLWNFHRYRVQYWLVMYKSLLCIHLDCVC